MQQDPRTLFDVAAAGATGPQGEHDAAFDRRMDRFELLDEAVGNEVRIFGPPGTGKTTYLSRRIAMAVGRYGRKGVMAMSLTKTAARELTSREIEIDEDAIGTLHSHTWHALGRPPLVETKRKAWNEAYPQYALRGGRVDPDVEEPTASGDALFHELSVLRARLVPPSQYPLVIRRFADAWADFKQQTGSYDFADLIDICLRDVAIAPGNPQIIFVDEAQDFSAQQMQLVRRWSRGIDMLCMAGDEDQLLYGWAGADVRTMLEPRLHESQIRILRQSYRMPAAVHRLAVDWIEQVRYRQPKEFRPRPEQGQVSWSACHSEDPVGLVEEVTNDLARNKQVMVLSACRHVLQKLVAELRERGIPFHNPYRVEDGGWNPLKTRGQGAAQRLSAFLMGRKQQWTVRDLQAWVEWLRAKGLLRHGAKARIEAEDGMRYVDEADLAEWFEPAQLDRMLAALESGSSAAAAWWNSWILEKNSSSAQFAARVVSECGPEALERTPRLVIGTVHSVKGAQADVVYLLPDLTRRWNEDWINGGDEKDALVRLFYVGMSRAREHLKICGAPRRGYAAPLPASLPPATRWAPRPQREVAYA